MEDQVKPSISKSKKRKYKYQRQNECCISICSSKIFFTRKYYLKSQIILIILQQDISIQDLLLSKCSFESCLVQIELDKFKLWDIT